MIRIADRQKIKVVFAFSNWTTSRFLTAGLLLCLACFLPIAAQQKSEIVGLNSSRSEFNNGNYQKAVAIANNEISKAKIDRTTILFFRLQDIVASSYILLGNFNEAETVLAEALNETSKNEIAAEQKALVYLRFASLRRSQRKFAEALEYCRKAILTAPQNRDIEKEYFLNIGRILFSSGYDVSAIVWFEKAEKLIEGRNISSSDLDVYRFLSLAWSSKLNYQEALRYAERFVSSAENSPYKYKHRQGLFEWASLFSAAGQKQKALAALEKGLKLSLSQNNSYQSRNFLSSLLLNSLYANNLEKASEYLQQMEMIDADRQFIFEVNLGKAVISAAQGQREISDKYFAELDKIANTSSFILPYWKITIAEKNRDWQKMISLNQQLLNLTVKNNFSEDLPGIYLNFAKAYFNLNEIQKSLENLEKALSFIEEIRKSEDKNLSLSLFETYHEAYRLLVQIKFSSPQESFELTDFLKARLLKDKISSSPIKTKPVISQLVRQKLEELSLKFITDKSVADEISKIESQVSSSIPELDLIKPELSALDKIPDLNNKAVISYFFTLDKKLLAFVWEKDKPLKTVNLPVSEDDVELYAKSTGQKIKNLVFFKRDGKNLYDKLVKPLNLTANHLIIIPDKSLWKIPFQALSSDGERYLIEEKTVSYAPSVSILLEQLKNPKPIRQSMQAFANSNFDNRLLKYVDAEATSVAGIYNSKPQLNATVSDFEQVSDKTDILHFSMHAQVDNEQPLESFLGFRRFRKDDGTLTVEEILKIKLKKGSLVFLASCDTNNVLSGEGLVSLAWAMMGSGATTVISAQWEANDKSTEIFTKTFYKYYKQGNSSAEALQKASLELIKNKANNMHEPYYWADFTLNGDYR